MTNSPSAISRSPTRALSRDIFPHRVAVGGFWGRSPQELAIGRRPTGGRRSTMWPKATTPPWANGAHRARNGPSGPMALRGPFLGPLRALRDSMASVKSTDDPRAAMQVLLHPVRRWHALYTVPGARIPRNNKSKQSTKNQNKNKHTWQITISRYCFLSFGALCGPLGLLGPFRAL